MPDRTRARQLAAEYVAKGDPTGWFEQLYQEAEAGGSPIPWAELRPNPNLLDFWKNRPISSAGKTALKIGCGFGDDAEQLARWGFSTTAFDISETAVRTCRGRYPASGVEYVNADLLHPPDHWFHKFDFVLEAYTLQTLPLALRPAAIERVAGFVKEGGNLLIIARGREDNDPVVEMPWPLSRAELNHFVEIGLRELSFEDFQDPEDPSVRRFRVLYLRTL
jgi:hypothetical protein